MVRSFAIQLSRFYDRTAEVLLLSLFIWCDACGENVPAGVQYHNPQIRKGSVILFKPSASTPNSITIPLKGLSRTSHYRLSYEDRSELDCVASGALLMDIGFNVSRMEGAEASEVIWIEEL